MFGRRKGSKVTGERRIGLVGCVKAKRSSVVPAKDLYTSALFAGRRRYVEASCSEWWILSAGFGLVHPEAPLGPYDVTLKNSSRARRRAWSDHVLAQLDDLARPGPGTVIEIHAGAEYRDFGLAAGLERRGCVVEVPTAGMGIGKQLQFYKNVVPGQVVAHRP